MAKLIKKIRYMLIRKLVGKDAVIMNMTVNLEGMRDGWVFSSTGQNDKAIVKPSPYIHI